MKKFLLLLILFFIPFMVHAEETTDVTLKDLVLKKTEGYTEVLSDAEIINNKIVLDLKMYDVGDSAEYQFMVENNSTEDYQLDSRSLVNSDSTIEYQIISEDKSSLVKKNSSKQYTLIVTYKNEVDRALFKGGRFDSSSNITLLLNEHQLINPETGSIFISLIFFILFISIIFILYKNNKIKNYLFLLFLFIPISVFALNQYEIELESNIIIGYVMPNPCTYEGELTSEAEFINGQYTYTYSNEGWSVTLTDRTSTDPVTTTLCTSINDKPIVSMSGMFAGSQTTSIDTSSFDTSHVVSMGGMFYNSTNITEIDVSQFDTSNATNMTSMFNGCSSLTELNISNFDLSKASSFSSIAAAIFINTSSLKKINMSNWKLPADMGNAIFRSGATGSSPIEEINVTGWDLSNTTNVSGMFASTNSNGIGKGGTGLKRIIGLDTWDTSNITDMSLLFQNCSSLTTLDLSSFDTSNVTSFIAMFNECSSLTTLDLSGFDTSKVTGMSGMFQNCTSLTTLDLSGFDFTNYNPGYLMMYISSGGFSKLKALNMSDSILPYNCVNAFGGLTTVETLILDNADTSNVTNMSAMFQNCSSLTSLDLSSFDTSNVTNMGVMFQNCSSLTAIDLSGFNASNVTNMSAMFQNCSSLTELDLSSFNTTKETAMGGMFYNCSNIEELNLSGFDFSYYNYAPFMKSISNEAFSKMKKINMSNCKLPPNCYYAFSGMPFLEELILDNVDTSNVTNMTSMFINCKMSSLDLSSFDTSNVISMSNMFNSCSNLTELDLSNFDTSNVTDFSLLFSGTHIEKLNLSNWDFRNSQSNFSFCRNGVVPSTIKEFILENAKFSNLYDAFASMYDVEYIDLKNADTSLVTSMYQMFAYDRNLKRIDLTNIDTSNVTTMYWMFYGCNSLTEIDVSSFNTSNVEVMQYMFGACSSLTELDLSSFDTSNVTDIRGMFSNSTSLTTGYARTQADAERLNASEGKPSGLTFVVKT